ncbi:MAG: hypothetical protein RI897_1760 [Verrucomicrobiota bacterium]
MGGWVDWGAASDGLEDIGVQVGDDEVIDEAAMGGDAAGLDAALDCGHFAADEDHIFSGADGAGEEELDVTGFEHGIGDFEAGGDTGEFDEAYGLWFHGVVWRVMVLVLISVMVPWRGAWMGAPRVSFGGEAMGCPAWTCWPMRTVGWQGAPACCLSGMTSWGGWMGWLE